MCLWRRPIASLIATMMLFASVLAPTFAQETPAPDELPGAEIMQRAGQAETPPTQIAVPQAEVLLVLVRNAIVALNHANFTGNYTVLRDLGSSSLQRMSAADLGIAFANLRQQNVDLSPVLVVSPSLTEQPSLTADGVLRLAGHFPTRPLQINFIMTFQPVGGVWRLHGLSVNTLQVP